MANEERPRVGRAKDYLRGRRGSAAELAALAAELKKAQEFRYARRLYALARQAPPGADPPDRVHLVQQEAVCTYKDPDLPTHARLERALAILCSVEDLATTENQESLGIAGAIYKRRFEVDGQTSHLERSLAYYLRAHRLGVESDTGYAGINAAFVLDVLACQELAQSEEAGAASDTAAARQSQARRIRTSIVQALPPLEAESGFEPGWWYFVTIGEAYFGLEAYDQAAAWLRRAGEYAAERAHDDALHWEFESTAKQLATLARLQAQGGLGGPVPEDSPQWAVVRAFLATVGDAARIDAGLRTAFAGKVGLALSGGGFRASLFHIGVLARLAELDMLRHVEVLSCVSGGSIIGAHYYLEVRQLLNERPQADITRDDYIAIVRRLEDEFLAGVQKNIRTRVVGGLITNLKMLFVPGYSRTQRVGELFEKHLYGGVARRGAANAQGELLLNELFIHPTDEDADRFRPKRDNWRRKHKVPILVLNATPLNTGHNWQFTASWMGEPPADIDEEIDTNYRLRRLYYGDAPARHRSMRLGYAVAASACVPGLFEPLVLDRLYPDRTVRLVDGGVHDNQGVASLIEQGCNVLLVSDASGQMGAIDDPGDGVLDVPLRSNGILMARVREAQFRDLSARLRAGLLRGLMFLHLKRDLDADPVDWIGCEDPPDRGDRPRPGDRRDVTSYGIRSDMQARLAEVRTDLDSFSDAEALALMVSGYHMAGHEFARRIEGFDTAAPPVAPPWRFLDAESRLTPPPTHDFESRSQNERRKAILEADRTLRVLAVAKNRFFKVWRLARPLTATAVLLAVLGVAVAGYWIWTHRARSIAEFGLVNGVTIGGIGLALAMLVLGLLVGRTVVRMLDVRRTLSRALIAAGLAVVGWAGAALHLTIFDRLYLAWGRVPRRRYVRPKEDAPTPPTEPAGVAVDGPAA